MKRLRFMSFDLTNPNSSACGKARFVLLYTSTSIYEFSQNIWSSFHLQNPELQGSKFFSFALFILTNRMQNGNDINNSSKEAFNVVSKRWVD